MSEQQVATGQNLFNSFVYMSKVKQGPLETEWLPILSDFLIHHPRMCSMVWEKYAVAQNTETSNIPLNKKEKRMVKIKRMW